MTDTSSPAPDPFRAWREAGGGEPTGNDPSTSPPVRPHRLFALVGAVCAGAVVLAGVAAARSPRQVSPVPAPAPSAETLAATQAAPAAAPGAGPTEPAATATAPTVETPLSPQTTAAAVLAVRGAGTSTRYVDTAVAEGATAIGSVRVVTVRALVLQRTAQGWDDGTVLRYAVPVGVVDGAATALSPPWSLAAAPPVVPAGQWRPVTDTSLAAQAARALRRAGYRPSGELALSSDQSLDGVVRAVFRGKSPAEAAVAQRQVWLDRQATAVLGTSAAVVSFPPVPVP